MVLKSRADGSSVWSRGVCAGLSSINGETCVIYCRLHVSVGQGLEIGLPWRDSGAVEIGRRVEPDASHDAAL